MGIRTSLSRQIRKPFWREIRKLLRNACLREPLVEIVLSLQNKNYFSEFILLCIDLPTFYAV